MKKYLIGLTGNIATGKSIVRRMLQELGASTIDADQLVHMLQRPGAPVYKEIVKTFGTFVVNPKDGTINRQRLGAIAFSSPEAMQVLEGITHPAVRKHIERVIDRAPTPVVVIEAIKLLEGGLAEKCDTVWVVNASEENQLARLTEKRRLSRSEAIRRIKAQRAQTEKVAQADVIIDNNGKLIKTWNQVQAAFNAIPRADTAPAKEPSTETETVDSGVIELRRAKRGDLSQIAALITEASHKHVELDEAAMMERLFSKGYLVALQEEEMLGVVGWQTENLIAGIDDFFIKKDSLWQSLGAKMIKQVEEAVSELSCEAGLVFLHQATGPMARKLLEEHGYEERQAAELKLREWREAALEWTVDNTTLMVKKLMERRMTPL